MTMAARRCNSILGAGVNFSASLHQWFPASLHHLISLPGARPPVPAHEFGSVGLVQREKANPPQWVRLSWWCSTRSPHDRGALWPAFREPPPHRGPRYLNDRPLRPLHSSLDRWFSRPVHSDEGRAAYPPEPTMRARDGRDGGPQPVSFPLKSRMGVGAAAPPAGSFSCQAKSPSRSPR